MSTKKSQRDNNFLSVGQRIAYLIESLGLTQGRFAKALGTSQGWISDIINGKKQPTEILIKLICNLYEIDEEWLVSGEGQMSLKAQTGEEMTKETAPHADTSTAIDQLMGGTGMYTIGDMVLWVMKNGTDQDREDLMMWKKRFIDCTSARIDEIKARSSTKKNKAG